jgi:hypothetical protein
MTKVLVGFQLVLSSLIHVFCCGLPILLSISGGLSIAIALQTLAPVIFCFQLLFSGFVFYRLYKSPKGALKAVRRQRIVFWVVSSVSFVLFVYPPANWFKSEETKLKKAQIERFFKSKNHKES